MQVNVIKYKVQNKLHVFNVKSQVHKWINKKWKKHEKVWIKKRDKVEEAAPSEKKSKEF